MSASTRALLLAASFSGAALPAAADFQAALGEYNAGHYEQAHRDFLALAELGDCSSQFNLAAMALKGLGGPPDRGSGLGWLQAAAGNGCQQLVGNKVAGLQGQLSGAEAGAAAAIVARYGRDALRGQGIVDPDFSCRGQSAASILESPAPEYPRAAAGEAAPAIVITELTIGVDGRPHDPEVLLAMPEKGFAAAAVEAWLNSRFTPASRNGVAVESRLQAKSVFALAGSGALAANEPYRSARQRSDAGDAEAQYLVGLTATLDSSFGISYARAGQMLLDSARDGNARSQYWVASQLRASLPCHPQVSGAAWLRHAASGGSAAAQLLLAQDLLAGTPTPEQAAQARELLTHAAEADSFYVMKHVVALLAASPAAGVRDAALARKVAARLAASEIQSDPQMFEALAAADAADGDFHAAVHRQHSALAKAHELQWNTRAMAQRLAAYRAGQAWYGDLLALPPVGARD
jgi:TPR repeat protein